MRFAPPNPLRIADRASGLNAPSVRSYNERLVLSLLLQNEGTTRLEIGEKTGLSAQTVSVIVRSLEAEGLVAKGEAQRGRVGPPTIPLMLNPDGAFSLGLSFGPAAMDVVVIDFVGGIRFHRACPYAELRAGAPGPLLRSPVDEALNAVPAALRPRIAGIGLAVPDEAAVGVGAALVLGDNLPEAQRRMEREFDLPVFMQNEITAAAGGESLFGVARHLSDFVFFYLGSRLHGRLILNHRIYNGRTAAGHDVGLDDVGRALAPFGLPVMAGDPWLDTPGDAGGAGRAWLARCRTRIAESVSALLDFIELKSLVLSTYAPSHIAERLRDELMLALPGLEVLLGRDHTAPKAWGAASLPYHSRFMVQ